MDWQLVNSVQQQTPDNDFCHFSISNVPFAFFTFFRKPEKLGTHTGSKWWPGAPATQWPSSMSGIQLSMFILYILSKLDQTTDIHLSGLSSRSVSTWGDLTVLNDELFRTRQTTPSGLVQSSESSTDCRLRPLCCHLGSYFKRPKSSLVRPLACRLQLVLHRL